MNDAGHDKLRERYNSQADERAKNRARYERRMRRRAFLDNVAIVLTIFVVIGLICLVVGVFSFAVAAASHAGWKAIH